MDLNTSLNLTTTPSFLKDRVCAIAEPGRIALDVRWLLIASSMRLKICMVSRAA